MPLVLNPDLGVTFNDSTIQTSAPSEYGLKNRVINGDFKIDTVNSGASITPGADQYPQIADGSWTVGNNPASFTAGQNLNNISPPPGFSNYFGLQTTAAVSGNSASIFHLIEGSMIADLNWGTANALPVTVSFWVRSSVAGVRQCTIRNGAQTTTTTLTYTINQANTWQYVTIPFAGVTTGTWNSNNQRGFEFVIGSFNANTAGSIPSGATWYITGVQLEAGTSATNFERIPTALMQTLTQRFNRTISNNVLFVAGDPSTVAYGGCVIPVNFAPMRNSFTSGSYTVSNIDSVSWVGSTTLVNINENSNSYVLLSPNSAQTTTGALLAFTLKLSRAL